MNVPNRFRDYHAHISFHVCSSLRLWQVDDTICIPHGPGSLMLVHCIPASLLGKLLSLEQHL